MSNGYIIETNEWGTSYRQIEIYTALSIRSVLPGHFLVRFMGHPRRRTHCTPRVAAVASLRRG